MSKTLEKAKENSKGRNRDSNLELFRIITMFLIVAHHYVVNSGILDNGGPVLTSPLSFHSIFLLIFGEWGKTGINCFVLITGYFMCKSNITINKFFKLFFEVIFYRLVVSSVFWISGYKEFSLRDFVELLIPVKSIDTGFTSAFLVFYLFIPFINIFIRNMDEKQHIKVLLLCFFTYVFLGTFHRITMNYVSWFIVLYLFSSYIRIYPKEIFENVRIWRAAMIVSVLISVTSVLGCTYIFYKINKGYPYYFVQDSNAFLAFLTGICCFMFFKNLKIKYNKVINAFGASTFGVLLIHANSDTMRQWPWKDTLNNVEAYYHSWGYVHALLSVLFIFLACSFIDMLRIRFIEKPFFRYFDGKIEHIKNDYINFEKEVSKKFNIKI